MTPTYHFEWDPRKAAGNLRKHGIDFEQAASVFLDPLQLTLFDTSHIERDEERWITLGRAENDTLLWWWSTLTGTLTNMRRWSA